MKLKPTIVFFSMLTACVAAQAHAQVAIRWGGASDFPSNSARALHAPDGDFQGLNADVALEVHRFGGSIVYSDLTSIMGVSYADLVRADVIAFEGNGGAPAEAGGWESSWWVFIDGGYYYVVEFNGKTGVNDPIVIANDSFRDWTGDEQQGCAAYAAAFGLCAPIEECAIVSYLLFDLQPLYPYIDPHSPNFSIQVYANPYDPYNFGEGTPDPDAIGVVSTMCYPAPR